MGLPGETRTDGPAARGIIVTVTYLVSRGDCRQTLVWDWRLRSSWGAGTAREDGCLRCGMAIKADDWVVHPRHGVGRVVRFEMRQFDSRDRQMYYQIALPAGTLWVPVEGPFGGLRKMTTRGELARYRAVLRGRPASLPTDHRERQNSLVERVKDGSFLSRCEAVRDLAALGWRKPLSESNAELLRKIRVELCAEWAAAGGSSIVEATQEIEALLLEGRKAHEG